MYIKYTRYYKGPAVIDWHHHSTFFQILFVASSNNLFCNISVLFFVPKSVVQWGQLLRRSGRLYRVRVRLFCAVFEQRRFRHYYSMHAHPSCDPRVHVSFSCLEAICTESIVGVFFNYLILFLIPTTKCFSSFMLFFMNLYLVY